MLRIRTLGGLSVQGTSRPPAGAATQARRLAVLALVARSGDRGITRERLLALLWPDAEEDGARRALSQALYALRRDLGADELFLGVQELRLNRAVAACDVLEFEEALDERQPERAIAAYAGPFLDGFRLAGAPEFERWADEERTALAHRQLETLERLARQAAKRGEPAEAVTWWRQLAGRDPLNARLAVELMQALVAAGDTAGALQHARIFEILTSQELGGATDAAVLALAARIRSEASTLAPATGAAAVPPAGPTRPAAAVDGPAALRAVPSAEPPGPSGPITERPAELPPPAGALAPAPAWPAPPTRPSRRKLLGALALLGACVVAGAAVARRPAAPGLASPEPADGGAPVVAVGLISDFRTEQGGAARPLADMLATNLARAERLRVVSPARVHELLRLLGAGDTAAGAFVSAARQAGAAELVEGTLYARPGGAYRLDLRRVHLGSGAVRAALTVEGRDLFALADSGTAQLLRGMRLEVPAGSIADVTTRSEGAYRDYDVGLRRYVAGESDSARVLFDRALRQDPQFAMAAYYRAMSLEDRADRAAGLTEAVRLAERASERERLLIRARWGNHMAAGAGRAVADSLVARYPAEVEGHLLAGLARVDAGEWAAARPLLERAAAMDSLSLRPGAPGECTACAALRALAVSHHAEGRGAEAVRAAERWVARQPHAAGPWTTLAELLSMNGRFDEARAAADSALARSPRGDTYALTPIVRVEIRRGRLDEAERLARGRVGVGSLAEHGAAFWMLNLTLRNQGRAREAVEVARAYRSVRDSLAGGVGYSAEAYMLGISLALAGRASESAAVFDSAARGLLRPGEDAASLARARPMALNELAWARYLAGDTAALPPLVDRVQAAGAGHAWRIARLAHHQTRGLLRAARGDSAGAVAEWRAAGLSTLDYPRVRVLLGRVLTRTGRPAEAVAALRPALGATIDATGAVPMAEVHEALAEAWARVPGPAARDSAAAHWRFVAEAWRRGDPPFAARSAAAARQLAALRR